MSELTTKTTFVSKSASSKADAVLKSQKEAFHYQRHDLPVLFLCGTAVVFWVEVANKNPLWWVCVIFSALLFVLCAARLVIGLTEEYEGER